MHRKSSITVRWSTPCDAGKVSTAQRFNTAPNDHWYTLLQKSAIKMEILIIIKKKSTSSVMDVTRGKLTYCPRFCVEYQGGSYVNQAVMTTLMVIEFLAILKKFEKPAETAVGAERRVGRRLWRV